MYVLWQGRCSKDQATTVTKALVNDITHRCSRCRQHSPGIDVRVALVDTCTLNSPGIDVRVALVVAPYPRQIQQPTAL
jgi:hypothetical protein